MARLQEMTVIVLGGEPIAVCETTAQVAAFFRAHPQESVDYETFVVPCFLATHVQTWDHALGLTPRESA